MNDETQIPKTCTNDVYKYLQTTNISNNNISNNSKQNDDLSH